MNIIKQEEIFNELQNTAIPQYEESYQNFDKIRLGYMTDDHTRVKISNKVYIPANNMSSMSCKKIIISQMHKLEHTLSFWQMLYELDIGLLIISDKFENTNLSDIYYGTNIAKIGNYKIHPITEIYLSDNIQVKNVYLMNTQLDHTKMVCIVYYKWDKVHEIKIADLIHVLRLISRETITSGIVLQDLNGSGKSGIILACFEYYYRHSIVNKTIVSEDDIVSQIVLSIILCRKCAINTFEEYKIIDSLISNLRRSFHLVKNRQRITYPPYNNIFSSLLI
jgi:protein tyrosine phosphatase